MIAANAPKRYRCRRNATRAVRRYPALFSLLFALTLLLPCLQSAAQRPSLSPPPARPPAPLPQQPARTTAEVCGNGIDDDGNGLADTKDYACYYQPGNTNCQSGKVIWMCTYDALLWLDTENGTERVVVNGNGQRMTDIAWGIDGKLYGVDENSGLHVINPGTGMATPIGILPYYFANGLTADDNGNLYAAVAASYRGRESIVKYNIRTGQVTTVVDMTAHNLELASDMCFMNGYLYVTCMYGKIARVEVRTGAVTAYTTPLFTSNAYGFTTLGDGYLYMLERDKIHRMDPATMLPVGSPMVIQGQYGMITGFATYPDACNSYTCRGTVRVTNNSLPPFCKMTGVSLSAAGTGLAGATAYTWTIPDGSQWTGANITAYTSGRYYVRYHTVPPDCAILDSIDLQVIVPPAPRLQPDSFICPGSNLVLRISDEGTAPQYTWHNGATAPQFSTSQPGRYYVTGTNACGTGSDTVLISPGALPAVSLGPDREKCSFDTVIARNLLDHPRQASLWSNGGTSNNSIIANAGLYWLEVSAQCGIRRDTVLVSDKLEGCLREVFIPDAFTPNRDRKNDRFAAFPTRNPKLFSLEVYNRWGERVFTATNPSHAWDGTFRGREQPGDLYVWICRYAFEGLPLTT
ncbi:MAG: T9SS type B sorting domain-containing protein, partial [Chitinophagaceae bacterium]